MSVISQLQIVKTRFPGYLDPSLPGGTWLGSSTATGDGSGGVVEVDLVTSPATAPFDSLFYSLEKISVTYTFGTAGAGRLQILNLGQIISRIFAFPLVLDPDASNLDIAGRDFALFPLFLGQQINRNATSAIAFQADNQNAETLRFQAEGYYWDVESANAPGGPSRPVQGMYSR